MKWYFDFTKKKINIVFLSFFSPTEFYKDENPDDEDDDGGRYHLQNAVRPQGILIFHNFFLK